MHWPIAPIYCMWRFSPSAQLERHQDARVVHRPVGELQGCHPMLFVLLYPGKIWIDFFFPLPLKEHKTKPMLCLTFYFQLSKQDR